MAQASPHVLARLRITEQNGGDRVCPIAGPAFRIGRAEDNDLILDDPYISRHHCEILRNSHGFFFRDLHSTSGTFINGTRSFDKKLASGDRLSLGRSSGVALVFESDAETGESGAARDPEDDSEITAATTPQETRYLRRAADDGEALAADSKFYGRVHALYEVASTILELRETDELLPQFLSTLLPVVGADRAAVLLFDQKQAKLHVRARRSKDGVSSDFEPRSRIISQSFLQNIALLALERPKHSAPRENETNLDTQLCSVICAPITGSDQVWGVCYADLARADCAFTESDLELMAVAARQLGLGLDNLHLLDEQKKTIESFIRTLAASIDARDDLTAGHSARVAKYSSSIAKYLGLTAQERKIVYYAGLLHDYGKIGTREAILCKPGSLTADEYDHIKEHALHTLKILSRIHFTREMQDLPIIAASHHERMDGSGYPYQIKGEDIPLGARIIALADYFDSLTQKRHYRQPVPLQEAIEEIQSLAGTQFDPKVIDAFMKFLELEYLQARKRRSELDEQE